LDIGYWIYFSLFTFPLCSAFLFEGEKRIACFTLQGFDALDILRFPPFSGETTPHFGELVQLDGSFHRWYEARGPQRCLITMVDDATSRSAGSAASPPATVTHTEQRETYTIENLVNDKFIAGYQTFGLNENGVDFGATKFYLGQELAIDPKTELSTDADANQLFTREYRKGFELPVPTVG
jgi:hypothetical protein